MDAAKTHVAASQARYESIPLRDFAAKRAALDDWRRATNEAYGSRVFDSLRQRARTLAGSNLVTTVRSNADGRYHFKDIKQGGYYVIAQHEVFDNKLRWAVPITLNAGENALNLTNSNGHSPLP